MTLPDLINKAAREGLLETLTLFERNGQFQANAKRRGGGWQCVPCTNPADGLETAVRGLFGYSNQPDAKPETSEDIFA